MMIYTTEAYTLALSELEKKRENAINIQASHVEIIKAYPDIYSLYTSIISTKDKLADAILSKKADIKSLISAIKDENLSNQSKLIDMLYRYGLPEDYLQPAYACMKCCDTGYVMGERCSCLTSLLDKYTIAALNKQCRIKLHSFAEFDLSYYPDTVQTKSGIIESNRLMRGHLEYCMEYAKNFGKDSPSLFMLGGTGLGKTFLSSCIAKELLSNGVSVAFDSIQNYLRDIEKEHFGKTEGDTLETLLNADLLILDDLGSEFTTSFNSSVIYNIINSRTNEGKPTIISTNLSIDELSTRYDERIISRLTGMFKPLRFIGTDIRQIKRQKGIYN